MSLQQYFIKGFWRYSPSGKFTVLESITSICPLSVSFSCASYLLGLADSFLVKESLIPLPPRLIAYSFSLEEGLQASQIGLDTVVLFLSEECFK